MKYSLLYPGDERGRPSSAAAEIKLPDTLAKICGDGSEYFAEVISAPLCDADAIKYRREILADLGGSPELTDKLKKAFGRYDRMRGDWIEMRGGASVCRPDRANAEASLAAAWASVRATAVFPGTLLSFVREIGEVLSEADISSRGLSAIRDNCLELASGGLLTFLAEKAGKLRGTSPERNGLELLVTAEPDLESTCAEITGVFELNEKKKHGFGIKAKKKGSVTDGEAEADAVLLAAGAMYHLDRVLSGVTDRIYSSMFGLSRELVFYECAVKYAAFLKEKGECVYPDLLPRKGGAEIAGLYDLRLLAEQDEVTPCDLRLAPERDGLLIRGGNGAGKTTFLRSVGTAFLMCQAGLPIPASKASLCPANGVYAHFSSAEEQFRAGDAAGRFEGEVRAVSDILYEAGPGALILLNETFQSTEYGEGTRAMRGVLSALPEAGIKYLLVTHLTDLFDGDGLNADRLEFDLKKHDYIILEESK